MKLTIEASPEELFDLPNYVRPDSVIGLLINELIVKKTTKLQIGLEEKGGI